MTTRNPMPRRQRGAALLMLLVALLMAGSYLVYRNSNLGHTHYLQSNQLAATLARAKEALIARAVTDANRPGSLPCPDLITDDSGLSNIPNDGKTDMFTMTQCPSYVGWLPWVTLDLPELTDDTGTRLWYVLARELRDDENAQPINSDTPTTLKIDGNSNIAALIIAPRGAIGRQNRPSNNPADYLDGENGNGDDDTYVSGPAGPDFNDTVTVITRQELMAAVEKRVANEVKSCLEQHAAAAANSQHHYPWPAPFSSSNLQGKAGSYFGQVPTTQPGGGTDPLLQQNIGDLGTTRSALAGASDANQQLTLILGLNETLNQSRNLFDALYIGATKLWQASQSNANPLAALTTELNNDLRPNNRGNVSIINSEQARIRSLATTVQGLIDILPKAMDENGIDAFPDELKKRTTTFASLSSVANAQAIVDLLSRSTTTHVDIAPKLNTTLAAALNALGAIQAAAAAPGDSGLADAATASAATLSSASSALQNTIENSRINTQASDITPYASQLASLNTSLNSAPSAGNLAMLNAKLSETKAILEHIATGTTSIVAARSSSLQALSDALTATQAANDYPLIASTTATAISQINNLATQMAANDDNLARTSLAAASADFIAAQSTFAGLNISSTRARVPYARSLQVAAVDVDFWAKIIASEAYDLATRAKAVPVAVNTDFSTAVVLDGSAYQAASTTLAGSQATAVAMQAYLATPTTNKQAAAATALANTIGQVDNLLGLANDVDGTLSGSTATAFPLIWLASRCDFLQPSQASWWNANQWANTLFYQIGNRQMAAPGSLTVNGSGNYKVVAIAAGQALPPQNRATRSSPNFFEGINADVSRDGNASNPKPDFASKPPTSTSNDRLAY